MNIRYPLIIASILILVILVSGCSDIMGTAKDKTCDFCKDRFKAECNKCPEGVNKDFVTIEPISSKCIEQCYDISAPLNTDCNGLREICEQVFGSTSPPVEEPPGGDEEVIDCFEYCESEGYDDGGCLSDGMIELFQEPLDRGYGCLDTKCRYNWFIEYDAELCKNSETCNYNTEECACVCYSQEICGSTGEECDDKCTSNGCTE